MILYYTMGTMGGITQDGS